MSEEPADRKDELLAALRDEFARWEKLLSSLPPEQVIARDLPAGLAIKDVLAHLWAWQGLSVARLEAALEERDHEHDLEPTGLDPDDECNLERINAWIHAANAERTWTDVYADWRRRYLWFLQLAEQIPSATLMQPARYHWLTGAPLAAVLRGSYEHHHEEHYIPLADLLRKGGFTIPD